MPVNQQHELYVEHLPDWVLCRAVCAGERAVKAEGVRELTLPRLSGHVGNDPAYERYVQGAHLFPAAARYRDGFEGLLFHVPPQVEAPAGMGRFLEDVSGGDQPCSAVEYVRARVGREVVTVGRCGTLTDFPLVAGENVTVRAEGELLGPRDLTKAEAERRGRVPTWTLYRAEDIWNWVEDKVGPRRRLRLLVLHEDRRVQDPEDRFVHSRVEQWRVLELVTPAAEVAELLPREARVEEGGDGLAYRVQIWRERDRDDPDSDPEFEVVAERWPRWDPDGDGDGELLTEIPFDVHDSENDGSLDPNKPPLLDIVTVNLGHLRNSAIREHAALLVGSPQAYITGYDVEEELGYTDREVGDGDDVGIERRINLPGSMSLDATTWHTGAHSILLIKSPNANPGMLSLKSEDLSALRDLMTEKREELVALGGRLLAKDKLAAEAARTEEIRREGERGVHSAIGAMIGLSLSRAGNRARDWLGLRGAGDFVMTVNTDFMAMMDAATALAVSELLSRGHLADTDMFDLLRRGRWVRHDRTDEQIRADLQARPPAALALGGGEPLPGPGQGGGGDGEDEGDDETDDEGG